MVNETEKSSEGKRIIFHDITAREAGQSPGDPTKSEVQVEDKVRYILQYAIPSGVDAIEGFYPSSNDREFEGTQEVARYAKEHNIETAIVVLGRARTEDMERCWDAVKEAPHPRIHSYITLYKRGLDELVHMTFDDAVKTGCEAIQTAKRISDGRAEVQFSIEHFGHCIDQGADAIADAIVQFIDAGADIINMPNTVEKTRPNKFAGFVKDVVSRVKEKRPDSTTKFVVHCHNDFGMATATAIACIETGLIDGVETATAPFLGERAGNTSMPEVAVTIDENPEWYHTLNRERIYDTAQAAGEIFHREVPPYAPVVGGRIWETTSGTHGRSAENKDGKLGIYVPFKGKDYGCPPARVIFSSQSGCDILSIILNDIGYKEPPERAKKVLSFAKELAYTAANEADKMEKLKVLGEAMGAFKEDMTEEAVRKRYQEIMQEQGQGQACQPVRVAVADGGKAPGREGKKVATGREAKNAATKAAVREAFLGQGR